MNIDKLFQNGCLDQRLGGLNLCSVLGMEADKFAEAIGKLQQLSIAQRKVLVDLSEIGVVVEDTYVAPGGEHCQAITGVLTNGRNVGGSVHGLYWVTTNAEDVYRRYGPTPKPSVTDVLRDYLLPFE